MNTNEKKEWLVKYAKRNNLDDILTKKYRNKPKNKPKKNKLKKYSSEIQSICSIISVLVIGVISIILTIQYNRLVETQNELLKEQYNPIIDATVNPESEYLDRIDIFNNGPAAKNDDIRVYSYIDVFCNENYFGSIPIRIYLSGICKEINMNNDTNNNNIGTIIIYNDEYPQISNLKKELVNIPKQFTSLPWGFPFKHLIEITTVNSLGESQKDYFLYTSGNIYRMDNAMAEQIIDECTKPVRYKNVKDLYNFKKFDADFIFRNILEKVRAKDLYRTDIETTEDGKVISEYKILYGEYEPELFMTPGIYP